MLAAKTFAIALGVLDLALHVNARCCRSHIDSHLLTVCQDSLQHDGLCCGIGKCNIFCCACAWGQCWGDDFGLTGRASVFDTVADLSASRALFASVNVAQTGALSLDEYLAWANSSGYGTEKVNEAIAYFHRFDANGDGFVSFDEMHVASK